MGLPYLKISELAGHIRQANKVSFITGAGASLAAGIPSAAALVKIIVQDYPHCLTTLSATDRTNYGPVMARLSPAEREALIQPLLTNARLNWGQVALAGMMQNGTVQRVLTFNFDLVLERAAALIGLQMPVYDFGVAPTGEINRIARAAIIHLHGQSSGLVLLNTEEETRRHADALRPLLQDTLCNGLTVVIGYSGAADGAFRVMAESYNSYHRLIWLGYAEDPPAHLRPLLEKGYAEYVGGCDFDLVMIALAKELGHWPPMIFKNPMEHVLTGLAEVIDFPVTEDEGGDVLTPTRGRLQKFSGRWVAEGGGEETAAQALISGEAEVPGAATDVPESAREKRLRAWAVLSNADRLAAEAKGLLGPEALAKFAQADAAYAQAIAIKPDMHEAFNNWGNALYHQARLLTGEAASAKFAAAGERYAEAIVNKPDKHEAFTNWGNALAYEARLLIGDAASAKFAEVGEKYAQAIAIKPDLHEAFTNWGSALDDEAGLLTGKAARAKYAEACEKYAQAIAIKPDDDAAFTNWCATLTSTARRLDGPEREAVLVQAEEKALRVQELLGKAEYNLACVHAMRGNADAAVAVMRDCLRDGTLPDGAHLDEDRDLELIRGDAGYLAFRAELQ